MLSLERQLRLATSGDRQRQTTYRNDDEGDTAWGVVFGGALIGLLLVCAPHAQAQVRRPTHGERLGEREHTSGQEKEREKQEERQVEGSMTSNGPDPVSANLPAQKPVGDCRANIEAAERNPRMTPCHSSPS